MAASEQAQQSNRRCCGSGDCEAKFRLHDEEGAQLRFEFETEIKRPEAARYCSVMAGFIAAIHVSLKRRRGRPGIAV
jgi:hypothetical protein